MALLAQSLVQFSFDWDHAPVFLVGDFNTPSQLGEARIVGVRSWSLTVRVSDWTPAAVQARKLPYALNWPMGVMLASAGFVVSSARARLLRVG